MTRHDLAAFALVAVGLVSVSAAAFAGPEKAPVLTSGRFEQVALTVRDYPRAVTFYRDTLGLRLMFEANKMAFFEVGGTRLMIARDDGRRRPAAPTSVLYFRVDDFAAALDRLKAHAISLVGDVETVQSSPSGMLRLQQFEDMDGNMLAIMGFVSR